MRMRVRGSHPDLRLDDDSTRRTGQVESGSHHVGVTRACCGSVLETWSTRFAVGDDNASERLRGGFGGNALFRRVRRSQVGSCLGLWDLRISGALEEVRLFELVATSARAVARTWGPLGNRGERRLRARNGQVPCAHSAVPGSHSGLTEVFSLRWRLRGAWSTRAFGWQQSWHTRLMSAVANDTWSMMTHQTTNPERGKHAQRDMRCGIEDRVALRGVVWESTQLLRNW